MWMWVCDVAVRLPPNRMWWKEYPSHYVGRQTTRAPILAYPLDDVRGSAGYRMMLVPELLRRAISSAREVQP